MKHVVALCLFSFVLSSQYLSAQPSLNYEFRAVWVATVDNIDWPSKKGLPADQQKQEFLKLLDLHARNGMNALIVQIRPAADAFYPSSLEPWSEFLTGKQGLPPQPYYDPLEFMITATHQRGMEFHAWLNPYRAVFNYTRSSISPSHVTKTHPEWFVKYGDKKYFNPGLPEVRKHTAQIVKNLITFYELDGIHMDDYFYPYRIAGKEFPDQASFKQYGKGMTKDAWRRSNCDSIIRQLQQTIRSVNPHVKFGISPFGVWRNKSQDPMGSDTKAGQTNYDDLYADILLWLQRGWIDYVAPQLYWERGHKLADYDVLLKWWNEHSYSKHLYIGQAPYRAGTNAAWRNKAELPEQIQELRKYNNTHGSIYFSSKSFEKNPNGWNDSLRNTYYRYPALPPPMPWINNHSPVQPIVALLPNQIVTLAYEGKEKIKGFGLLTLNPGLEPNFLNTQLVKLIIANKVANFHLNEIPDSKGKRIFAVSVDYDNNVSPLTELK